MLYLIRNITYYMQKDGRHVTVTCFEAKSNKTTLSATAVTAAAGAVVGASATRWNIAMRA